MLARAVRRIFTRACSEACYVPLADNRPPSSQLLSVRRLLHPRNPPAATSPFSKTPTLALSRDDVEPHGFGKRHRRRALQAVQRVQQSCFSRRRHRTASAMSSARGAGASSSSSSSSGPRRRRPTRPARATSSRARRWSGTRPGWRRSSPEARPARASAALLTGARSIATAAEASPRVASSVASFSSSRRASPAASASSAVATRTAQRSASDGPSRVKARAFRAAASEEKSPRARSDRVDPGALVAACFAFVAFDVLVALRVVVRTRGGTRVREDHRHCVVRVGDPDATPPPNRNAASASVKAPVAVAEANRNCSLSPSAGAPRCVSEISTRSPSVRDIRNRRRRAPRWHPQSLPRHRRRDAHDEPFGRLAASSSLCVRRRRRTARRRGGRGKACATGTSAAAVRNRTPTSSASDASTAVPPGTDRLAATVRARATIRRSPKTRSGTPLNVPIVIAFTFENSASSLRIIASWYAPANVPPTRAPRRA